MAWEVGGPGQYIEGKSVRGTVEIHSTFFLSRNLRDVDNGRTLCQKSHIS